MPKKLIDEKKLSPSQLRKLTAIRRNMAKLLGDKLGRERADQGFAEWLAMNPVAENGTDANAEAISEMIWKPVQAGKLQIPRGGYLVRRGRGRIIVEAVEK